MTSRPPQRTRFAAWLSLAAMLLLVLGAPIGQTSAAMNASGSAAAHEAHSMHHAAGASHAADTAEDVDNPGLHDQCGYCSLFSHCPAVAQAELGMNLGGVPPPRAGCQPVRDARAVATTFPNALTRAPPRFIDRSY
ncbi:DUF2946 domain-containing protein [Salinicola halophilus]|uniref:DUF2946 domain-containing protein n=1 Tax=Salinicola halophilus TaxID=184065 RepID=UPI0013A6695F|nr:DUF2946 domain-containing protein [Salinicola halophilus]